MARVHPIVSVIMTVVMIVSVPLITTSTSIQTLDCATTRLESNASAVYLLRDCPAVTIATIANSDVTLFVDNCTVLFAAFAPGDVLSNVHLTFTRSVVLTPLNCVGKRSPVTNVTVVIDSSNVSYDSWACSGGAGHFVFFETSEATNITIVMMHSYFEMRNAINSQIVSDSGLFRVYTLQTQLFVGTVSVTVLNSTVNLMYANITSSDDEITTMTCGAALIHLEVRNSTKAHGSNVAVSISDSMLTMEGSSGVTVVVMDSFSAVQLSTLRMRNTIVNMTARGPVDTAASRKGSLFDLNNITASHVYVNSVQLRITSVAGTVASRLGRTSALVRSVKGAMVTIGGDSSINVQVHHSVLTLSVRGGQFSYYFANVAAYIVDAKESMSSIEIVVSSSSTTMDVKMTMCPYRRMVQPQRDNPSLLISMSGLYLNFFVAHVSLQAPLGNVSLSVTDSNVSSAFPDMSHCYPIDTMATVGGFTFQAMFLTSYTTSSVIGVSARALSKHSLAMFIGLPPFMLQEIGDVSQVGDTIGMPRLLFVQSVVIAALFPINNILAAVLFDGLTLQCSKLVAPSPLIVSDSTIAPRTDATVASEGNMVKATDATLVYLLNVTMGAGVSFRLGPCATAVVVSPLQAASINCGLVVASNGTSLRGSSWVFEGITVDVARGSWFSLFGAAAGGSVVLPSREDVTLQCVRWVGRRLVPFGDGGAMLDSDCGGSVTPTTAVVVAAGLGGSGGTLQAAAAFLGGTSSVAAALGSLFGDAAASSDVQALAVLGMVMCAPSGLKAATGPMVYLLSPFAGLGSAWAGGGNVLLGTAVAGVHAAGVVLLGWRRGVAAGGGELPPWPVLEAAARDAMFPSLSFTVALLLANGASRFGLGLLRDGGGPAALGALCVVWSLGVACVAVAVAVWREPRCRFEAHRAFDVKYGRRPLVRLLLPLGWWEPAAERRRLGRLTGPVRGEWRRWCVAPLAVSYCVNVVSVVPASSGAACVAQWSVLCCVSLCGALYFGVARPARVPFSSALSVAVYVTTACICATAAAGSHGASVALEWLSIVLCVLNVARVAHGVWVMAMERWTSTAMPGQILGNKHFDSSVVTSRRLSFQLRRRSAERGFSNDNVSTTKPLPQIAFVERTGVDSNLALLIEMICEANCVKPQCTTGREAT